MSVHQDKFYTWDYSEKSDILNVHKTGKKTSGSAELGEFTFDFDKNGNVIGIEIINVSEVLKPFKITKDQLDDIKSAEIIIRRRGNYFLVYLKMMLPQKIERVVSLPAIVPGSNLASASA